MDIDMDYYMYFMDKIKFPELINIDIHNVIKNKITSFYFNLTRKSEVKYIIEIGNELDNLLDLILRERNNCEIEKDKRVWNEYLSGIYKMIGQTRDVVNGKGEKDLTYMMIIVWYKYFPVLSIYALRLLTQNIDETGLFSSYGSWADIKYFCHFLKNINIGHLITDSTKNTLTDTAISLVNHQIDIDRRTWNEKMSEYLKDRSVNPMTLKTRPNGRDILSLATKWVPREKSKYGWLYEKIVIQWYNSFSPKTLEGEKPAYEHQKTLNKCMRQYRKMISTLNKELDTPQIKQCNRNWSDINPETVSIMTLMKQKKAFCNAVVNNRDRKECADLFCDYYTDAGYLDKENTNKYGDKIQSKRTMTNLGIYVDMALKIIEKQSSGKYGEIEINDEKKWLNDMWLKVVGKYDKKTNMIPIINIDWNMSDFTRNNAIGLGLLIAERSIVRRVMISEHQPEWFSLADNFVDSVSVFENTIKRLTEKNLSRSFYLIFDVLNATNLNESDLNITYILISDFEKTSEEMEEVENFRNLIGEKSYFIYWNVSSKNIELVENIQSKNTTFVSGYSVGLLEYMSKYGVEGVRNISSYEYIGELLNHPRYKFMGEFLEKYLCQL